MKAKVFTGVLGVVLILVSLSSGLVRAAPLPPEPPALHAGRVALRYTVPLPAGEYVIFGSVTIHDIEHMPLPGATVTVEWNLPGGILVSQQAITDARGQAQFQIVSPVQGAYQLCVTNVVRDWWVYQPKLNEQTCGKIQVPRLICVDGQCPSPIQASTAG